MTNWNDPNEVKQYHKKWSKNNIEKRRMYDKNWKKNNPKKLKENSRKHELKRNLKMKLNPEYKKNRYSKHNIRYKILKMKILNYYSNNSPQCMCCKENKIEFLTIDHINGDGSKHRKEINNRIYNFLHKNNYPKDYQILCYNCNLSKKNTKKCYHLKSLEKVELNSNQISYRKIKTKVMTHYCKYNIPFCVCCGENELEFLSIDHINGGGTQHRKKIGISSYQFYLWLVKNNYPKGFQVLCFNCNFAKGTKKYCPHKDVTNYLLRMEEYR